MCTVVLYSYFPKTADQLILWLVVGVVGLSAFFALLASEDDVLSSEECRVWARSSSSTPITAQSVASHQTILDYAEWPV